MILARILVCGGRQFDDYGLLHVFLTDLCEKRGWLEAWGDPRTEWVPSVEIIHGGAAGADTLADKWAVNSGGKVTAFEPLWDDKTNWGPAIALLMRNQRMLVEGKPDLIVAFPGGRGTADMVDRGRRAGVEVIEV